MNVPIQTIDHALWLVACDPAFMTMLYDWYVRDFGIPGSRRLPFDGWIREKLDAMAGCLHSQDVKAEDMASALRINATGDVIAVVESIDAKAHGFNSDVNCYVEEGVVFSSVWLRGFDAKSTIDRAEEVEKRFKNAGYATDIYVDENDKTSRSVTVNAQIDFKLYKERWQDGSLAKATSIYRNIMI